MIRDSCGEPIIREGHSEDHLLHHGNIWSDHHCQFRRCHPDLEGSQGGKDPEAKTSGWRFDQMCLQILFNL